MELKAYWKDRTPQLGMCVVKEINFEERNASISNGAVRVFPMLDEIEIIRPTGIKDSEKKNMIYEGDYVEDDKNIYLVKWHDTQACFWLEPVKSKVDEDLMLMVIDNQRLGNGYYHREDLKIIGNKFETKIEA